MRAPFGWSVVLAVCVPSGGAGCNETLGIRPPSGAELAPDAGDDGPGDGNGHEDESVDPGDAGTGTDEDAG